MEYQIFKISRSPYSFNGIVVSKNNIRLSGSYVKYFPVKRYVVFAKNEDAFLCLHFMNMPAPNSSKVTKYRDTDYRIRIPKTLQVLGIKDGKYDVKEEEGWIITNCKLNNEEKTMNEEKNVMTLIGKCSDGDYIDTDNGILCWPSEDGESRLFDDGDEVIITIRKK